MVGLNIILTVLARQNVPHGSSLSPAMAWTFIKIFTLRAEIVSFSLTHPRADVTLRSNQYNTPHSLVISVPLINLSPFTSFLRIQTNFCHEIIMEQCLAKNKCWCGASLAFKLMFTIDSIPDLMKTWRREFGYCYIKLLLHWRRKWGGGRSPLNNLIWDMCVFI